MKARIMKRAHVLAKQMVGDWYARLSLALRQAWREAKETMRRKDNLPKLEGSEKQVSWASKIRDDMICGYQDRLHGTKYHRILRKGISDETLKENSIKQGMSEEKIEVALAKLKKTHQELQDKISKAKTETSAKWFIENRLV